MRRQNSKYKSRPIFRRKFSRGSAAGPAYACLMLGTIGCAASQRTAQVWTPPSRVTWQEIGAASGASLQDGFQIVTSGPTRGIFPAAVGVTRIAVRDNQPAGTSSDGRTLLARDPRNEFLRWNSTFDNLMAISEVFPIDQRNLGGAPAEPVAVLAAVRAFDARLGLIYAFNEISEAEAEMFGVLYDAKLVQPIALLHARAASALTPEQRQSYRANLWENDARALVRDKFEHNLRSCVRELVAADEPAEVIAPEGWAPVPAAIPPAWPPLGTPMPANP